MARFFMKNASVCLYDEPTASLDIETEWRLLSELSGMASDRICILITHRLSGSGIADRIVLLRDGRVQESGTYESLMAEGGNFTTLADLYKACHSLR